MLSEQFGGSVTHYQNLENGRLVAPWARYWALYLISIVPELSPPMREPKNADSRKGYWPLDFDKEVLREARFKSRMTMAMTAQLIGCSASALSGWERGITAPKERFHDGIRLFIARSK